MTNLYFISRHVPTQEQVKLAEDDGYEIIHLGDVDAFDIKAVRAIIGKAHDDADGEEFAISCVHPMVALQAISLCDVVLFENANRAPEGEKPSFHAIALHIVMGES